MSPSFLPLETCDYGVLNASFQALAPLSETWAIQIQFHDPWSIGDFRKNPSLSNQGVWRFSFDHPSPI